MVTIYVPLFWTGSHESLLKFITLLNKIIHGQDLATGPQKFGITRNIIIRDSLRVFEKILIIWEQRLMKTTRYL